MVKLSIVIPVYNEEKNIVPLYEEVSEVCLNMLGGKRISAWEIVFVNDGSRDETQKSLEALPKKNIRIVKFRKNFGQTAALKAGFENSSGDLIATLDGDLQNDPKDIPKLLDILNKGYDVVSGWRFNRKDKFGKRVSSKIMNWLRRKIIGDRLHDYGCSLKIYRRECIKDLELHGELHRYITAYLHIKGYKIAEVRVNHRPRKAGVTKYKFNRGLNGLLDLLFLKFWQDYSNKPVHFFGRLGIYQWILAGLIVFEQIVKAFVIEELRFGPLLALASMLVITGLLFIIFGFLFEILTRIYYKEKDAYSVEKII